MSVPHLRSARMTGLLVSATAVAAGLVTAGSASALTGPEAAAGRTPPW